VAPALPPAATGILPGGMPSSPLCSVKNWLCSFKKAYGQWAGGAGGAFACQRRAQLAHFIMGGRQCGVGRSTSSRARQCWVFLRWSPAL